MRNPTRRNKHIGTARQGYKTQSKFNIPSSWHDGKAFYERLEKAHKIAREINGQTIMFIVEPTRKDCSHACTVEDIERVLSNVPRQYYEGLTTFILRQPKVKEELLSPVWGRLIYLYEIEKSTVPVIILEAVDCSKNIVWGRKLSLNAQKELVRLREDGHEIIEDKRRYTIQLSAESVRNTQLYRTLLHEIGHYYHYISTATEVYDNLATAGKEVFAHDFADNMLSDLKKMGIIPFVRQVPSTTSSISDPNASCIKPVPLSLTSGLLQEHFAQMIPSVRPPL